jgi:hypothetical protein
MNDKKINKEISEYFGVKLKELTDDEIEMLRDTIAGTRIRMYHTTKPIRDEHEKIMKKICTPIKNFLCSIRDFFNLLGSDWHI